MKKLLYLMAAAAVALAACEKKDELNSTQKRINELTALEKTQAKEVRAAVPPAVENIEGFYWRTFDFYDVPQGTNLFDSTTVHIKAISRLREVYGNPLPSPVNNEAISSLFNKCGDYIGTFEELEKLKKQ
jgi:hypothetical protein